MPSAALRIASPESVDRDAPALRTAMLLTAADLARELGVSVKTISRLNQSGRIPRPIKVGDSNRWSRDAIFAWIAAGAPNRATFEALHKPK